MPPTSDKAMIVEMDATERDFFVQAIYSKWSEAVDAKKLANAMTYDKRRDGDNASFIASKRECIENANKMFAKFDAMLNKFKGISPLVNGEWFKP